jgi:hypothetical protein
MRGFKRRLVGILLLALLLLPVQAQETIILDELKLGTVSTALPTSVFTFTANAGQTVMIEVVSATDGLAMQFTVSDANGTLVKAVGNPTQQIRINDTVTFPQAGPYSIQLASANGLQGQFILQVRADAPQAPAPQQPTLLQNQPVSGLLGMGEGIDYNLSADPTQTQQLSISSSNGARMPATRLLDATGNVLAQFSSALPAGSITIPAGNAAYRLELTNDTSDILSLGYAVQLRTANPATPVVAPPQGAIPTVTPPPGGQPTLPGSGPCVLATQETVNVNLRGQPAVFAPILTTISPLEVYSVVGRVADSSWYQILANGTSGWVAGFVTRRGGDCNNLPVTGTLPPTPTPTLQPSATPLPFDQLTPTADPERVAGDNEYRDVQVEYNGDLIGVSGAISYPNGDRQDTVTYRWVNVNGRDDKDFSVRVLCRGTGVGSVVIEFADGSTTDCRDGTYNFLQYLYEGVPTAGSITVRLNAPPAGQSAYVEWSVQFRFIG